MPIFRTRSSLLLQLQISGQNCPLYLLWRHRRGRNSQNFWKLSSLMNFSHKKYLGCQFSEPDHLCFLNYRFWAKTVPCTYYDVIVGGEIVKISEKWVHNQIYQILFSLDGTFHDLFTSHSTVIHRTLTFPRGDPGRHYDVIMGHFGHREKKIFTRNRMFILRCY